MSLVERRPPSANDLRWFGAIVAVFFGILATVAWLRFERPGAARILGSAGVAIAVAYYAVRALRVPLYLAWMRLFYPLGWTVSHLVLGVIYFLVVTPIALVMRLLRHDPLERRFRAGPRTYWVERRTEDDPARYLRQF